MRGSEDRRRWKMANRRRKIRKNSTVRILMAVVGFWMEWFSFLWLPKHPVIFLVMLFTGLTLVFWEGKRC
jgi:hypothetical protein